MYNLRDELVQQEYYQDMRRQSEAARQHREMLEPSQQNHLSWVGDRLVALGKRLSGRSEVVALSSSKPELSEA